jgi:hypothetical protein
MKIELSDAAIELLRNRIRDTFAGTYVGGQTMGPLEELFRAGLLMESPHFSNGGNLKFIARLNERGREYAQRFGPGRDLYL